MWTGRWCHRKKWVGPDTDDIICRSRWVVRQFKSLVDGDCFSGCPGLEAVRVLLAVTLAWQWTILPADVSVAFMHTPMDYVEYVEAPPDLASHLTNV